MTVHDHLPEGGTMSTVKQSAPRRADVVKILADHRQDLAERGVRSLAIFGSVARDEAEPDSDVDVLVELERPAGYFALARVQRYLESILDRPVDIGTPGALDGAVREAIAKDCIRVA
jgi:predicted nucleotidyltransferase